MTTSTVWKATNSSYGDTCHFGDHAAAVAWARGGDVVPVEVQHYTPPALHVPRTGLLAEAVRMIQGYQRAGWLTNPAAGEQARDFIARASIEPGSTHPDTTRLNWWFVNVVFSGDDDEEEGEIIYEAALCETPAEFRKLIDAHMGDPSTNGEQP